MHEELIVCCWFVCIPSVTTKDTTIGCGYLLDIFHNCIFLNVWLPYVDTEHSPPCYLLLSCFFGHKQSQSPNRAKPQDCRRLSHSLCWKMCFINNKPPSGILSGPALLGLGQGGRDQNDCISWGRISEVTLAQWGWKVWEWHQNKNKDWMCRQEGRHQWMVGCSAGHRLLFLS